MRGIHSIHKDANHGNIVRSQFVLQPQFVTLGHNRPTRLEGIGKFGANVNHGLIRQKFKNSIRRQHDDLILRRQFPRQHFRHRNHPQLLRNRIPNRTRERRAGIIPVRAPNPRRIAPLVDFLPQYYLSLRRAHFPVGLSFALGLLLVDGFQSLDLVQRQDARPRLADAYALVAPVRGLIPAQREGLERRFRRRVALLPGRVGDPPDDGAAVSHVADCDSISGSVQVYRYGGGAAERIVEGCIRMHPPIAFDVRGQQRLLRRLLGQLLLSSSSRCYRRRFSVVPASILWLLLRLYVARSLRRRGQ
mmetsp:Transcript_6998/g.15441  ORF Transcript_6998/g.15441 Transcript_6998/m.15441 type:complete len:304 (-) Transcript_6998:514-1425(-)